MSTFGEEPARGLAVKTDLELTPRDPSSRSDRAIKRDRVREIADARGPGCSVLLTSAAAVSWYLDGARVDVAPGAAPLAAVLVAPTEDRVHVFSNEVDRLVTEQLLPDSSLHVVRWDRPLVDAQTAALSIVEHTVVDELRAARASLLPGELSRYRALTGQTAAVVTRVLSSVEPTTSELELAAVVARELIEIGADPQVLLVAGESRLAYRHPVPTTALLGQRAMVVVCARRHGMIANLTRWVRFAPSTSEQVDREAQIVEVEAEFFRGTVPGARLDGVLVSGIAGYEIFGFGNDEWTRHHQGGPTGYLGRDPRATQFTNDLVVHNQVFAWNPSAFGVKVEDTVLLGANGIVPLTVDPNWPTVSVRGRQRPAVLER